MMQREKEKAETKDRKLLEILTNKDDEIHKLHSTITSMKTELDDVKKRYINNIIKFTSSYAVSGRLSTTGCSLFPLTLIFIR